MSETIQQLSSIQAADSEGIAGQGRVPAVSRHTSAAMALLGALLLVFVLLQSVLPLRTAIQIGADEGFELAKAILCASGYHLYTDVWNDQPPLHTFITTEVLKHLTASVVGPRLVTSAFTVLLLSSVVLVVRRISGMPAATLSVALLIAAPGFVELSASCMLEIPALAPIMASLCLLLLARPAKWPLAEILAGVLFGAALLIKLIGLIYLPPALLILWFSSSSSSSLGSRASSRATARLASGNYAIISI